MCRTSFPGSPVPVLLKSHTSGLLFFYGAKDTASRNELNNCSTKNGQRFIWFILMELYLPSSCVNTTEAIPVADEELFYHSEGWRQNRDGKATVKQQL